jgi:hypothetical protein
VATADAAMIVKIACAESSGGAMLFSPFTILKYRRELPFSLGFI